MEDGGMHGRHDDRTTAAGRHLLPRRPSDLVVTALVILGIFGGLVTRDESVRVLVLLPPVVATLVQKVNGHRAAWRSEGVERAFILESSAISFYVVCVGLAVLAALQVAGVVDSVDLWILAVATLFVDTTVRQLREGRFA